MNSSESFSFNLHFPDLVKVILSVLAMGREGSAEPHTPAAQLLRVLESRLGHGMLQAVVMACRFQLFAKESCRGPVGLICAGPDILHISAHCTTLGRDARTESVSVPLYRGFSTAASQDPGSCMASLAPHSSRLSEVQQHLRAIPYPQDRGHIPCQCCSTLNSSSPGH